MTTCDIDPVETESVLRFLSRERKKVLSLFEFKQRIFGYQLNNYTYYRLYKELVSDHAPIEIECSTNLYDLDN